MKLLVGLGNPGSEYAPTRHNIGFIAVDEICHRYNFSSPRTKFHGELSEGLINGTKVLALKPMTFMNKSGISVAEASRFYKIPVEDIIVIHDELDLPFGKLRVKTGGGHGGHNGLRDVDAHMGKNYIRIRFGIDHPGDKNKVTGYVLNNFNKAEQADVPLLVSYCAEAFPKLLKGDEAGFMNHYSLLVNPPVKKKPAKENNNE